MKTPTFKQSKRFLSDINIPCLVATAKNSELSGVGAQHIAEHKEDPTFKIYLRGKDPKKISVWQQEILEQLFEKDGLVAAVTEGMKEYETKCTTGEIHSGWPDNDPYGDFEGEEREQIKEHGIAPFLIIGGLVIDDIDQKVLISADNISSIFHEHLITIYLSEGQWHFEDGDYWNDYHAKVRKEPEEKKAQKLQKRWEAVLSPPEVDASSVMDGSVVYGVWRFNPIETEKLLKQYGTPQKDIERTLSPSPLGIGGYYFSATRIERLYDGYIFREFDVVGCERKGNWFTFQITMQFKDVKDPQKGTYGCWCDGKLLVITWENNANAYSRTEDSHRKGMEKPESISKAEFKAWADRMEKEKVSKKGLSE